MADRAGGTGEGGRLGGVADVGDASRGRYDEKGRVRAAGGVVWRRGGGGGGAGVEVLLVHRPAYDDWTFPKGKRDAGESDEEAALREVEEETGLRCSLGAKLPPVRYIDHNGREKVVTYWAMEPASGEARAQNEVDELAWLEPDAAAARLTYAHDVDLLDVWRREALG